MSGNEELKRQIALLQSAINKQRPSSGRAVRYSGSFRPPSQRFSPMRPAVRPSRNMKLIVKNESRTTEKQPQRVSREGRDSEAVRYVSSGNKLVRVGSGLPTVSGSQVASAGRPRPVFWTARPRNGSMAVVGAAGRDRSNHRQVVVNIDGEEYVRRGCGNKLVRTSAVSAKPNAGAGGGGVANRRIVSIDGEDFVHSKKGSLIRVSALRQYNMRKTASGYHRGLSFRAPKRQKRLCTRFLYDRCESSAEECAFSHELAPETVPLCLHYQRDMCTKPSCHFMHTKVNPGAPICRDFVYRGFCPKGSSCKHRHVWQCPDWVEKGKCMRIKCKLPHPTPSKKTVSGIQDGVDAAGARRISKEDEEDFVKNYIQRPVFGGNNESDEINDLLLLENELNRSEDEDGDELGEDGEGDLEDDLSGDEAEELLKWYDDNLGNDKNADPNTA